VEENMDISELDKALVRLNTAVSRGRSAAYCHRLWSKFIRLRDLSQCVICDSPQQVSAHHILRKSFLVHARYEVGNGITLCHSCHAKMHAAFNGRPDLGKPMDAEGGEKIERMIDLLGYLASDASDRGILCDKYYYLSDQYLVTCKRFQGIDEDLQFPGTRLEQAYWIWRQTPRAALKAILEANGFSTPSNFIQLGPLTWI
jgi:hypothetical protein